MDKHLDVIDAEHLDHQGKARPIDAPGAVLQQVEDADGEVVVFAEDDLLTFPSDAGLLSDQPGAEFFSASPLLPMKSTTVLRIASATFCCVAMESRT